MQSKTTIAGIIIAIVFIAVSILVFLGKTTYSDASPVILGVISLVGGWGLFKAQDEKTT